MILIADSGSTKTDWCLEDRGKIIFRTNTQGINPFHQDLDEINQILIGELLPSLGETDIAQVAFYGSGCRAEKIESMRDILSEVFPQSAIEINSDLLAAARSICCHDKGIACILGTGSNSCLYDGEKVVENTPPLGYILGDEGSGAVLGKLFINALYKHELPESLTEEFTEEMRMTLADIIYRVYCQPLANRYLASLSPFIHKHLDNERVSKLVINNFKSFFRHDIAHYGHQEWKVGAIGSVAFFYREQLMEAAKAEGYELQTVMKSPMDGLVKFHK